MGALLHVDQNVPAKDVLRRAADVLRAGGVLVMPTDSVYGIGCAAVAENPGHEQIFAIKHRDRAQTLPWLVGDARDLLVYGTDVPEWAERMARELWPGPLTLVVQASDAVPREYRAANGTIALRVPDSNLVRELVREVGPLATTSANTHGEAAATSGAGVEPRIVEQADLTLDAGPAPVGVASTIVDATALEPRILRQGAIGKHELYAQL
ncbi:MAG: threonylcarbamoyl-AMP synthase [Atopobiaceae bacterium]|nr:threonylcarbamoyl-AMP synthase [Atopobiaceae bacterium]